MDLIKTPKQLLIEESGILQNLAEGGQPSTKDMQAELIVNGHSPQKFILTDVSDEDIAKLVRNIFLDAAVPHAELIRKLLGPMIHDLMKNIK